MEKVRVDIPAGRQSGLRVSWIKWEPREERVIYRHDIGKTVVEATPDNADLRRWSAKPLNQPDPSWFEEDVDPFSPEATGD